MSRRADRDVLEVLAAALVLDRPGGKMTTELHGNPLGLTDAVEALVLWRGDATCIMQDDEVLTFRDVVHASKRAASYLAQLGVGRGDRLAYLDTNDHRMVVLLLAAARIGALLVPLNYRLKGEEVRFILEDSGASVCFVGPRYTDVARTACEGMDVPPPLVALRGGKGLPSYAEALANAPSSVPDDRGTGEDPLAILYTSGTTGFPKGAVHSHASMLAMSWAFAMEAGLTATDTTYVVSPMFHLSGLALLLPTLLVGGRVAIAPDFDPERLPHDMERTGTTFSLLVPTMLTMVVQQPTDADLSCVRLLMYGGAPMFVETLVPAQEYFGCDFIQGYGLTEGTPLTILPTADHRIRDGSEPPKLRSVGRATVGCAVEVRRNDGSVAGPGERGEIFGRSGYVMRGYWQRREATQETLAGGWLATGDIGEMDDDGYLYIVDRAKDMIIRGGENIYPAEVERVLTAHPAVLEAAVVGVPDPTWGEQVAAVVVLKDDVPTGDLSEHCREALASYKVPAEFHLSDALPRNASGKVLKQEVRRTLSGGAG